ncbi:hypothetical protein KAH94_05755 [bacterium]|nr:hypothetical protein [bacterium]
MKKDKKKKYIVEFVWFCKERREEFASRKKAVKFAKKMDKLFWAEEVSVFKKVWKGKSNE